MAAPEAETLDYSVTTTSSCGQAHEGSLCSGAGTYNQSATDDLDGTEIKINRTALRELLRSTFRRLVLPSVNNLTSINDTNLRMNVNQITFAILISVLIVADVFLVWCLGYILVYYEQRGRMALRHFKAIKRHKA